MEGSIDSWIERWADSDRIAFTFEGGAVSYRRLATRIASVAAGLDGLGVGPGDRVLWCGLNRVELFELLAACARLGAALCPVNNRLAAGELASLVNDCRPRAVVVTDGFAPTLADAIARAGLSLDVRDLDSEPFEDRSGPHPSGPHPVSRTDDTPLLVVYTSGTTGTPKGAVLTTTTITATVANGIEGQDLSAEDVIIAPLPTFHVGGLNIQTLPTLAVGGRVALTRRFDPGEVLGLIRSERPTQTLLVPAMLDAVAGHPDFDSTDLGSLSGIMTGSSVVPLATIEPYLQRGIPIGQVYGTTETGPTATVLRYDEASARPTSCGRAAAHSEIRIIDPEGQPAEAGNDGEVLVKGANLFSRYHGQPEATAAAMIDGWYRTGDVGRLDEDGYLTITDRLTDVVISGGENIYPAELEQVLAAHPAIAEIAVVGRPDERWGEVPVAVVVPSDGRVAPTAPELATWARERLARFKHPKEVVTMDELPRTALGKVTKHVLRDAIT